MHINWDKTKDACFFLVFFLGVFILLIYVKTKIIMVAADGRKYQEGNLRKEISSKLTNRTWIYFGKHGVKTENNAIQQKFNNTGWLLPLTRVCSLEPF